MTPLRPGLPPLPPRIARLPVDARGYPVPWFVSWFDGLPDFRVADAQKMMRALREHRCWICGDIMGVYATFVIGPMCSVNRISAEPPSHKECATFAVHACPFMLHPQAVRRDANMPDGIDEPPGVMIERNPGVMLLWTTKKFTAFQPHVGGPGVLFQLGDPTATAWYCQGRLATHAEVVDSIHSGLPTLMAAAEHEGAAAVAALQDALLRCQPLLPQPVRS